jgi:hypothetical protein
MNFADEIVGNFYSKEFVRKRILKQTQEEIMEIDKQIELEKAAGGAPEEDEYASYKHKGGENLSEDNEEKFKTNINDIFKKVLEEDINKEQVITSN